MEKFGVSFDENLNVKGFNNSVQNNCDLNVMSYNEMSNRKRYRVFGTMMNF